MRPFPTTQPQALRSSGPPRWMPACAGRTARIGYLALVSFLPAALSAAPFSHDRFDQVLQEYVHDDGLVRYAALAEDRALLDAYVDSLGHYSPESHPDRFPSREHELAYWINAYNAFVLRGVIDAYPIASVKDAFVLSGFFNRQIFVAGGREMTLDHVENKIIRPTYQDPRIHFAVNCAALSCPQLENRAFTGSQLDARLEGALTRFAQDSNHVRLQDKRLYLSKILDWYGADFTAWFPPDRPNPETMPTIVNYLRPYLPADLAAGLTEDIAIEYNDYDWALNEAAEIADSP